jgi:phage baseplate assembly protein V
MIFCPDGEPSNGVILGGVYRDKYPQPRDWDEHATVYRDTAVMQYNPHTGVFHIELPEEVWPESEADEEDKKGPMVVITAPKILFRGDVLFTHYPALYRSFSDKPLVEKDRADEPDFIGAPCPPGCI